MSKKEKDSMDKEDKQLMTVLKQLGIDGVSTSRDFINHLEEIEHEEGIRVFGGKSPVVYKEKFEEVFKTIIKYVKSKNFFTTGLIRKYLLEKEVIKKTYQMRTRKGKEKKVKVLVTNDDSENAFSDNVMRSLLEEMCEDKILMRWLPPEDSDEGWTTRTKKNKTTGEVTTYKIPIKSAYFINPEHEIFKEE